MLYPLMNTWKVATFIDIKTHLLEFLGNLSSKQLSEIQVQNVGKTRR